jgi:NADPH:quinone reductase-like Zn-dependent oxidoreductase
LHALVSQYNPRYSKASLPSAWKDAILELCRIEAVNVRSARLPQPQPENAIYIQTACGSLNYSDLNTIHAGTAGWYGKHAVFGAEIAGWVMRTGKHSRFKEGDLVVTRLLSECGVWGLCKEGKYRCTMLASQPRAGFQERVWVPEVAVRKVRPGISPLQAVALQFSASVAMDLLERCLLLRAGQTLLVAGANGAIGTYLTQMAARKELSVINIVRSQAATSYCLRNGAAAALVVSSSGEMAGLRERLPGPASAEGIDAVVDLAADFYGPGCLKLLKAGGAYLPAGWSGALETSAVNWREITGRKFQLSPYSFRDIGYDPLALLRDNAITPAIDSIYPYTEAQKACERAWWSQGKSGKVVITFADQRTCAATA